MDVGRSPAWSLAAALVLFAGAATGTAQAALAGYHNATAWAISDTGVVVGNWLTPDNQFHAFRWDPDGRATDLGTLPGESRSMAEDISGDGGVIAGSGFRGG